MAGNLHGYGYRDNAVVGDVEMLMRSLQWLRCKRGLSPVTPADAAAAPAAPFVVPRLWVWDAGAVRSARIGVTTKFTTVILLDKISMALE